MSDPRIAQMSALADDIRTLAADMQEERDCEALTSVRRYVDWVLCAIDRAAVQLAGFKAIAQCTSQPMGGGQCQLFDGHPGKHKRTSYPYGPEARPFVFEWDDESQRRLADKEGSRFD